MSILFVMSGKFALCAILFIIVALGCIALATYYAVIGIIWVITEIIDRLWLSSKRPKRTNQ